MLNQVTDMKNITRILIAIAAITLLASWGKPLSSRTNDFVDNVEKSYKSWTKEDWDRSEEKYVKLLEEYKQNYDSYAPEEKAAINKAIGRYNGILVKQGIEGAGQKIKDFGERLPSLIEGFVSAFEVTE
jgi:hypothetical protein